MTVIKPEMLADKITRSDLLPLSFIAMTPYTGSRDRLRDRIEKTREGQMKVSTWFGPNSYDNTEEDLITVREFDFSEEAVEEILVYLNRLHDEYTAG